MSSLKQELETHFGFDAFLPGQEAVLEHLMAGHSAAAVFPTGGGKSLCYQLPALLLDASARRERHDDGLDVGELLDASTLRALQPHLLDPNPDRCRAALDTGDLDTALATLVPLAAALQELEWA